MKRRLARILTGIILMLAALPSVSEGAAAGKAAAGKKPLTAKSCADEAAKKASVTDSIAYLVKTIPSLAPAAEKRAAYAFLAGIQEQAGLYGDACASYAAAAAISAGDAGGMAKKSAEQLVLDAVRCALSSGDTKTADSYLNSTVRASSNETVLAWVKVYEQWSALISAASSKETAEPIALLKTYSSLPSMASVRPTILLTLWHISGEKSYADSLKKAYPQSPEAGIVQGSVQQLPAPFWYFVPRQGKAEPEFTHAAVSEAGSTQEEKAGGRKSAGGKVSMASANSKGNAGNNGGEEKRDDDAPVQKASKQQLGLFRERANAEHLVAEAGKKGFKAYITTETRPSGTTYFLVVVDENKGGTIAQELRTAGFDCYPVF